MTTTLGRHLPEAPTPCSASVPAVQTGHLLVPHSIDSYENAITASFHTGRVQALPAWTI